MIASTVIPGVTTAAPRLIAPWLSAFTTPAPAPEDEQEGARRAPEQPTPFERRVVEVEHRRELDAEQRAP